MKTAHKIVNNIDDTTLMLFTMEGSKIKSAAMFESGESVREAVGMDRDDFVLRFVGRSGYYRVENVA